MADARYGELGVDEPADAAEGLSNFLWELGALGVVEEEAPGTAPRLRAFVPDGVAPSTLAARVGDYLASLRTPSSYAGSGGFTGAILAGGAAAEMIL